MEDKINQNETNNCFAVIFIDILYSLEYRSYQTVKYIHYGSFILSFAFPVFDLPWNNC